MLPVTRSLPARLGLNGTATTAGVVYGFHNTRGRRPRGGLGWTLSPHFAGGCYGEFLRAGRESKGLVRFGAELGMDWIHSLIGLDP